MARDQETITAGSGSFVQLTNGNVTRISFQVISGMAYIHFTAGETPPDDDAEGWLYKEGEGELNKLLSDLTNLSGANRVWARGLTDVGANVQVDHA